jgi:hypothetical protein
MEQFIGAATKGVEARGDAPCWRKQAEIAPLLQIGCTPVRRILAAKR